MYKPNLQLLKGDYVDNIPKVMKPHTAKVGLNERKPNTVRYIPKTIKMAPATPICGVTLESP